MAQVPGFPRDISGPNLPQQIARLRRAAKAINKVAEVDKALEQIENALLTRPLPPATTSDTFGDPRYTIPPFKVSVAIIRPVAVTFGASVQPIVLRGVKCYPVTIIRLRLTT